MKKYEYKVVNFGIIKAREKMEAELNLLGQQGWELVTFTSYGTYLATLKREIEDKL